MGILKFFVLVCLTIRQGLMIELITVLIAEKENAAEFCF